MADCQKGTGEMYDIYIVLQINLKLLHGGYHLSHCYQHIRKDDCPPSPTFRIGKAIGSPGIRDIQHPHLLDCISLHMTAEKLKCTLRIVDFPLPPAPVNCISSDSPRVRLRGWDVNLREEA